MSDMPEDLRWIAEHVSEWPENYLSVDLVINDSVRPYGKCCNYFESRTEGTYAKPEWQAARQALGLDQPEVTEAEEEEWQRKAEQKPAWAGSVPEGVETHDSVNKPKHYQLREGYEVYDLRQDLAAKAANGGATYAQYSDWDRAIEYIIRMWGKNRLEDAKKGRWYLDKLIEKLEAE